MGLRNIRRRAYPHVATTFYKQRPQLVQQKLIVIRRASSRCLRVTFPACRAYPRPAPAPTLRNKQCRHNPLRSHAHPQHPLSYGVQGLAHYAVIPRQPIDVMVLIIKITCNLYKITSFPYSQAFSRIFGSLLSDVMHSYQSGSISLRLDLWMTNTHIHNINITSIPTGTAPGRCCRALRCHPEQLLQRRRSLA